jgi:beta-phosphoglucomutase-like phosphatase (HAD superfamily)
MLRFWKGRRSSLSTSISYSVSVAVLIVAVNTHHHPVGVQSFDIMTPPPSPPILSAVLFDIDGTLVRSDPIHFAVFQELLLKEDGFHNNEPIDEVFFRQWISGRANPLITADFFPEWSLEKRAQWSIQKEARFREVAKATMKQSQMPGLDRLRDWIDSNGLGKAAVTNAPRDNAEAILSGIGYDRWFVMGNIDNDKNGDYLIIGDECERPKPDPCPYLTACKRLGVTADQCIVFEDSPSGSQAGVAAGAFVVGILSGQEESTLIEAGCHMIIQDFNDPKLWKYLERIQVIVPVSGSSTPDASSSSSSTSSSR